MKDKPSENPSWTRIHHAAKTRERQEMDLISREFGLGTFRGRIVANWCRPCGAWRLHYVPKARVERAVDGFTEEPKFPCSVCKSELPLIIDEVHTILRNV